MAALQKEVSGKVRVFTAAQAEGVRLKASLQVQNAALKRSRRGGRKGGTS